MRNIYQNGTYIDVNPTLHEEDSEFKFSQIVEFLDLIELPSKKVRILDVGGGAGKLGFLIAEYYNNLGYSIDFTALDLSKEMLKIQKERNRFVSETINDSLTDFNAKGNREFDITLMIDVIEHIKKKENAARVLNLSSRFVIYNIPLDVNLVDGLRNIFSRGRYYLDKRLSLGHIHLFNYRSALGFISKFHQRLQARFVGYYQLVKSIDLPVYTNQHRGFGARSIELKVSKWIKTFLPPIAPFIIQGSVYCVVKTKLLNIDLD